jgi:hypothetical protein
MHDLHPNRIEVTGYHGKCGGDLDGASFNGNEVYFAPEGEIASTYAEHMCLNGPVKYNYTVMNDEATNKEAFMGANPVVFKVVLTLEKAVTLDTDTITKIAKSMGIDAAKIQRFVEDFEDSGTAERESIFSWIRANGFDGVVLLKDLMPVAAGGDWDWVTSYVAFDPSKQVRFALS